MRSHLTIVLVLLAALFLSCTKPVPEFPENESNGIEAPGTQEEPDVQEPNIKNMTIEILIGSKTFQADIEDSDTGRAFYSLLPMKLSMSELNGNEKYHYLSSSLPTKAQYYGSISAGDLMLFGSSCVVLFYGSAGGYSYTRIGKLKSTSGLSAAVGSSNVTVEFRRPEGVE